MADVNGRRPEDRTYLLTSRSRDSRDRPTPRAYCRHTRPERFRQGTSARFQPVGAISPAGPCFSRRSRAAMFIGPFPVPLKSHNAFRAAGTSAKVAAPEEKRGSQDHTIFVCPKLEGITDETSLCRLPVLRACPSPCPVNLPAPGGRPYALPRD